MNDKVVTNFNGHSVAFLQLAVCGIDLRNKLDDTGQDMSIHRGVATAKQYLST